MNPNPLHNRRSTDKKPQGAVKPDREGGEANAAAPGSRDTPPAQAGTQSMGSRAGSSLGSQTERTGMGDGALAPGESSQGLTGAQGSGGGSLRGDGDDARGADGGVPSRERRRPEPLDGED